MAIEKIIKFTTSDGKEFTDRAEAQAHEMIYETKKNLEVILSSGYITGRVEAVISVMVSRSVEVRDELNKFIRRGPKKCVTNDDN